MSVDRVDTLTKGPEPTAHDRHRAALTIAHHAQDAEECLELLRMLGLAPPGFHWTGSIHNGADKRRRTEGDS